jgi:hypothetical protein
MKIPGVRLNRTKADVGFKGYSTAASSSVGFKGYPPRALGSAITHE